MRKEMPMKSETAKEFTDLRISTFVIIKTSYRKNLLKCLKI